MTQLDDMVLNLKAVGEVTRLRLLALLSLGELSVKDLTQILKQSQPRVSRHLKLLVESGFVTRHAQGAWAYFSITQQNEKAQFVYSLLSKLDLFDAQLQEDRNELKSFQLKQRERSEKYFSKIAKKWDLVRSLHSAEELIEKEIMLIVGSKKYDLAIDLGTGTASMLELLKDNYVHGVGVDSNKEMIKIARSKLSQKEISHSQIRFGNILELDEYENKVDLAIMHQVLHYFNDPGAVINSVKQILKKNGEMLIVDFAPHDLDFLATEHAHRRLGLSQDQMEFWAKKANLEISIYKKIPNNIKNKGLSVCIWLLKNKNT